MPDGQSLYVTTRTEPPRWADAACILLIVAAAVLLRLTSFVPAVVDTDEGLYMVQAREWLNGGWPLVAAWDMHPIGAPAMFALAFLAFGVSVEAVRLLGLICVIATGCALFGAARAAGAPRSVGTAAAIIYAGHTLLLSGLCTNTELLIAPFVTTAMALAIQGAVRSLGPDPRAPGWGALVAMGLLVGWALVVKQVAVPTGCLAFAVLLGPALWRRLLPWRRALAMAAAYAALCATPFLAFLLVYWAQGWLADYLDGSILAPFRYSMERIDPAEAARRIGAAAVQLTLMFLAALVALALWRPRRMMALLAAVAVAWFGTASLAIAGPGFFFEHYFLLWLPSLSLLAAIGAWHLARLVARPGLARPVLAGLVLVLALQGWVPEMQGRLERGPGLMHRDPVREVAAAVAAAAGPGGDAFIANYHTSVYVIAGVRIATRFPFPPHLTGYFEDLSDTSTHAELERVLAARPRVIVVDRAWMQTMRPAAAAQVLAAVAEGYELAATVAEQRGPVEIYRLRSAPETAPAAS
ncbi:ArnT family glycosyltransferase [Falsiroseomonas sp.]|uniref:ArnT family glycosyltransferase n=1 Tax=Falsiroseomonas sp. TaxID=2870721 RepID=UPI003F6F35F8